PDRRGHPLPTGGRRQCDPLLRRTRLRGRRDQGPALPDGGVHRPGHRGHPARGDPRGRRPGDRRRRPVWHQPVHGPPGRRGRALAGQTGHRHQCRDLVDGAARQRHRRPRRGCGQPAAGPLTVGGTVHDGAADVLVVGAGPGGLACAISAAEGGARVLLLDKADDIGGALPYSGGHLSAGGFSAQRAAGIEDAVAAHWADVRRISRGAGREDLTLLSLREQPATVEWLLAAGFEIDPATPRIVHGHEQYRTPRTVHAKETPGGPAVLAALRRLLEPHVTGGAITVACGVRAGSLLRTGEAVTGVEDTTGRQWHAPAVVLATGGFGYDPELFAEWEGAPLTTSAAPTSTGDGL